MRHEGQEAWPREDIPTNITTIKTFMNTMPNDLKPLTMDLMGGIETDGHWILAAVQHLGRREAVVEVVVVVMMGMCRRSERWGPGLSKVRKNRIESQNLAANFGNNFVLV